MQNIKGLIVAAIFMSIIIVGGVMIFSRPKTTTLTTTSPTQAPQEENVQIITLTKTGFSPNTLTVSVGMPVRWINKSGAVAAVSSNPNTSYPALNFGNFSDGSAVELVFDKAGTYHYINTLSPSQSGTVIVQ